MKYLLILLLLIEIFITYRANGRNIVSVSFIACGMFLLSVFIYVISDDYFGYEIGEKTVFTIVIMLLCITLGEWVSNRTKIIFNRNDLLKYKSKRYGQINVGQGACFLITIFVLAISCYYFIDIYLFSIRVGNASGNIWNIATFVRRANLDAGNGYSKNFLISQGTLISSCLVYFCVYCYLYNRFNFNIKLKRLFFPIIAYIPQVFASDSRTGLLNSICISCIIIFVLMKDHNNWRKNDNRRILKIGVSAIILFLLLFRILGYRTGASAKYTLWGNLAEYISAGIVGLDISMINGRTPPAHFGGATLKGIYQKLEELGLIDGYTKSGRAAHGTFFDYAHGRSNIYTALMTYINDYSFFGAMVAMFLWGYIINSLLKKIKTGDIRFTTVTLFGVILYPVAMISIGDVTATVLSIQTLYMVMYLKLIELFFMKYSTDASGAV